MREDGVKEKGSHRQKKQKSQEEKGAQAKEK